MATGGAQLPKTQGPPGRVTGEQGDRGRIPVNLAVLGYVLPVSWGARGAGVSMGCWLRYLDLSDLSSPLSVVVRKQVSRAIHLGRSR